jgi:hypothetical protein
MKPTQRRQLSLLRLKGIPSPAAVILDLRNLAHVREVALVAGAYFTYMYTRKLVFPDVEFQALDNAVRLVSFLRDVGMLWEVTIQAWLLGHATFLVYILNWAYVVTFWPIVLLTAIAFYIWDRPVYRDYRTIVLLSFGIALLVFMLFPLAPPRFLTWEGFVDTVKTFGPGFYSNREAQNYFNAYAAMPSVHFGFTVLFGYLFFRTGHRWLQVAGVLYPVITLLSIVGTGNHYFVDAAGGLGVALAAAVLYRYLLHRRPLAQPAIVENVQRFLRARANKPFQNSLLRR